MLFFIDQAAIGARGFRFHYLGQGTTIKQCERIGTEARQASPATRSLSKGPDHKSSLTFHATLASHGLLMTLVPGQAVNLLRDHLKPRIEFQQELASLSRSYDVLYEVFKCLKYMEVRFPKENIPGDTDSKRKRNEEMFSMLSANPTSWEYPTDA